MKSIIKVELKRSLLNRYTLISLFIGVLISMSYIVQWVIKFNENFVGSKYPMSYPITVFTGWLCSGTFSLQSYLYYMLLPIIVVIPFSLSYYEDKHSGYIRVICNRVNKEEYLKAKYLSVFISGGIVFVIPLILNLMVSACLLPSLLPQVSAEGGNMVRSVTKLYELFYSNPYIYIMIYLIIDFIFSGLFATISVSVASFATNKFVVLMYPLIIFLFQYSVFSYLQKPEWTPVYFLNPGFNNATFLPLILYSLIIIIVTLFIYRGEKNNDIF